MTIRDIAIAFGFEVDKKSEKKANDSINNLKSAATKVLGAIGIGFSLVNANKIIEEFGKINAQIKNATDGLGDQKEIQDEIINAANAARAAYADIAGLTAKLVQQNRDLFDVSSAAKYAELTTKLFKGENKSQSEILSLQEAINKSFAKGAVDAETVNQIIENSPAAADLLAVKIGAARSELATMASDGKISLEQLRDAFLDNAGNIDAAFGNVNLTISDALLYIRNGWGLWLSQMDSTLGLSSAVSKLMTRAFDMIMNALKKVQVWTERVAKAFGGAENMLKMLAIAGGAVFAALNAGKILGFLKNVISLMSVAGLKFFAIAAVIAIIALLIDDFINFMQGNDSLLGELLKMAGIDADAVRETILRAWETIKTSLAKIWEFLKITGEMIWNGLKEFWNEHGESIMKSLSSIWESIKTLLITTWEALKIAAVTIFESLKKFWDEWGGTIISVIGTVWDLVGNRIENALELLAGVFRLFAAVFTGDWEGAWNAVKDIASSVWDFIVDTFTAAKDIIVKVFSKLCDVFTPLAAVRDFFIGMWEGLKAFFGGVVDWFKKAFDSIANFFRAVWSAVAPFFKGVWNLLVGVVKTYIAIWLTIFKVVGAVFMAVWSAIVAFFTAIWETMAAIVNTFVGIFTAAFTTVSNFFMSIWSGISGFFTEVWEGIKSVFSTVSEFFGGVFTSAADAVKTAFDGIKEFFKNLFESVANIVKVPINGIISGINKVLSGMNNIKIPDWVPNIGGKGINFPSIPLLAKGGVLAKGQTGFLEGSGAEAVVPLEKNTGWVKKVAALFGAELTAGNSGGADAVKGIADAFKSIGGVVGKAVKEASEKAAAAKSNADSSGLTDAIKAFGADIAVLAKNATASPGTVRSMVTSTSNKNVTQNNYFESTFNGDRAGQKRSSEAMSKSANDATGQLARALAYSR